MIHERGWQRGLGNLLRGKLARQLARWVKSRRRRKRMIDREESRTRRRRAMLVFTGITQILSMLVGCGGPSVAELEAVDYTPLPSGDWPVSMPEEQGLDPMLVAELYHNAEQSETLYGLLVIKNGHLVAEKYFHAGAVDRQDNRQSVTKSIVSALVGIALEQGCLSSVDQEMMAFFPELADQIQDPRKDEITIRHLLQMRAGYPWEESDPALWEGLISGNYLPLIAPSCAIRAPVLTTAT
jgi:CubicO group peptidase (beta-lactamase class C family)